MPPDTQHANHIKLHSDGLTFSARQAGPLNGTPVILLHGFPDTPKTWEAQIPALAAAGYRVIAPHCRGYERSSQSLSKRYQQMDLGGDVINWMNDLGIENAHLVGHDWGSSIAQTAALLAPERFMSLTIMAVPPVQRFFRNTVKTPKQLRNSWYMGFFQLRGIADWKLRQNNFAFLEKLWKKWSPNLVPSAEAMADLKHTFAQPGVTQAALSYYRQALNVFSPEFFKHQKLFEQPFAMPTLAVSGKDDGCIDHAVFLNSLRPEDFSSALKIAEIENAGHFMNQEKPEEINRLLLDWFKAHTPHGE